jgi:hypothetical protein
MKGRVVGYNDTPITNRIQGLKRVKAETACHSEFADFPVTVPCTYGLRAVFDDMKAVAAGYFQDGIHICRSSGQMYRNDGLGSRCNDGLYLRRIDVEVLTNICKDRPSTNKGDAGRRGDERVRGSNYLIAGSDAKRPQGQNQGTGTVAHSDRVSDSAVLGESSLKGIQFGPHDELTVV